MLKPNKKKGFTIVELVIVIAVVGVLTAVLIPTFVNLTNRAKEAENQTFVRNLNTQMGIREATEGKNKTMYEAMMEAEDIGYNVEKLTPVDGNDVVWDSVANRFAIVKPAYATNPIKENVVYSDGDIKVTSIHQLWKAYDSMPSSDNQSYSIYAKEGWKVSEVKNLKVGFDAGKNEGINAVEYGETSTPSTFAYSESGRKGPRFANDEGDEDGKKVVIRTNSVSTTLTIDDASTNGIYHYGVAGALNIIQCHTASYHENGKVAYAEIAKGRIVLEKGADVEEIHINKKGNEQAFDTVIIANNGGAEELPERITRDAVTVSSETLVVTVESNGSSENVYVYASGASGTTQKVTVGENKQNEAVNSALGQLVLDNGLAGEKAQTSEQKATAKDEVASEAASADFEKNPENANYVARIGQTGYLKIKDAINASTDGKIVVLLKDVEFEDISGSNRLFVTHNITLDGNSHTVTAHGRGFGIGASKVTFKNVIINNPDYGARCIDTRGGTVSYPHVEELTLINVVLSTPGSGGYLQPLTIGGNQTTKVKINIDNCELKTNDNGNAGYTIITFNPVDLTIRNSKISGWSALYMKGIDGSVGSAGSTVKVYDSELYSFNKYKGSDDNFGTIVLEDADINILLQDCMLTANTEYVSQSLIVFSAGNYTACTNSSVLIHGKGTITYGELVTNGSYAGNKGGEGCFLEITGGTFAADPTDYVDAEKYEINGEGPYTVSAK